MDITEEQMPPSIKMPPRVEKGPPRNKPDTGSSPDLINPTEPDEDTEALDPMPDMDPDGQDPNEDEVVN